MRKRWITWMLGGLPVLALACGGWPQDVNLLYATAFRVSAVQNCATQASTIRSECLQGVMTEPLISRPGTAAQLELIRYSSLRDLAPCSGQELQQIRQAGGQRAALWACMGLLHYPGERPAQGVAVAVDPQETDSLVSDGAAGLKITQIVTLPLSK